MSQHSAKRSTTKQADSVDRQIGLRIAELRTARGMTRKALSEKLGITHQQLQKYERGINRITASRLLDIAASLAIPIASFLDSNTPEATQEQQKNQRLYVDVMHNFAAIKSRPQQDAIRTLIQSLTQK